MLQPMHNQQTTINSSGGGSVQVIIPASPYQVRANSGTSQPCRSCIMVAGSGNTSAVRVQIGTDCTSTTGILVPKASTTSGTTYLSIPIDDLNLLYFIGGTQNDTVDILWRN
jgi:hypothetical protein